MTLFLERRELLARFRAGERAALEETYRHYAPVVAAFLTHGFTFHSAGKLMRFGGYRNAFDLDNALSETFLRAFKEPGRLGYDGLNPYKGYLLAIARNFVIDELRSKEVPMSALSPSIPAPGEEREADETAGAEEDLLGKELAGLLTTFVSRLGERDRSFFRARFEEARTQVEAGREVGLSHMQARTLEKRMREKLLRFLHDGGYLEGKVLEGSR